MCTSTHTIHTHPVFRYLRKNRNTICVPLLLKKEERGIQKRTHAQTHETNKTDNENNCTTKRNIYISICRYTRIYLYMRHTQDKYEYGVLVCRWLASSLPDRTSSSLFLQLRVIRAFKSTLEDLEERRSVHSLHSLHSMRSSRSHTGPRPLSDFTYIDEDPTNTALNAGKLPNKSADQNLLVDHSAARMQSANNLTSPLLLTVTGSANAYNHHNTINTTNDNRSSSNSALNQALSPNHTQMQSSNSNNKDSNTGNSLLLSSNNLALPELTKLVHETSI